MTTTEATDGRYVADRTEPRATARSRAALKDVYVEHYPALANFALRLTGNHALAEDIVHEAFTRLIARRFVASQPVPYLYRTVGNLATDAWRRARRDERVGRALGTPDAEPAVDVALRDAVRRLPKAERIAITLYYFADLAVADVAQLMGKPQGTVRWLLTSARERLADQLGGLHA